MQKLMEEKEEKQKMCEKQEKIMETEQWQAFPSESQVKFGADTVNLSYYKKRQGLQLAVLSKCFDNNKIWKNQEFGR